MFERFTDRAKKVMALANQEAQRFNHAYLGTEHVLLGLVKEGAGVGANVLNNLGVDLRRVRVEVDKLVKSGPETVTMGKLPLTPLIKKAIDYAIDEARGLNHSYIGTEHLLLGLLREVDGVAVQVLTNLGLRLDDVRSEVLRLLGQGPPAEEEGTPIDQKFTVIKTQEKIGPGKYRILAVGVDGGMQYLTLKSQPDNVIYLATIPLYILKADAGPDARLEVRQSGQWCVPVIIPAQSETALPETT